MADEISPKLRVSRRTDRKNSGQKIPRSSLRVHFLRRPVNLQGVHWASQGKALSHSAFVHLPRQKGDEWKRPSCCMCEWVRLWVKVPSGCSSCLRDRIVSWYKMHDFRQKTIFKNEKWAGCLFATTMRRPVGRFFSPAAFGGWARACCVCVHVTRRDREKSLTISHAKSACERAAKRLPSARPSAELRRVQILHLALSLFRN